MGKMVWWMGVDLDVARLSDLPAKGQGQKTKTNFT